MFRFFCSVECGKTYFISNVNFNSRPGEKFKVAKKRRGSDLNVTMDDLTSSTTATQGAADCADVNHEDDCNVRMGSGACVKSQMCCHRQLDLGGCDVRPLALKTPREASHLVK